jgi:hypothetical protein
MQIPENPSNDDIREALIKLSDEVGDLQEKFSKSQDEFSRWREEIGQKIDRIDYKFDTYQKGTDGKVDRIDYKFDTYQKGTDGMVRMATTIIIATASVVVLSSLSPAVTAIITALYSANAN